MRRIPVIPEWTKSAGVLLHPLHRTLEDAVLSTTAAGRGQEGQLKAIFVL